MSSSWALPQCESEGTALLCPGRGCQMREVYENVLIGAIIAFFSSSGLFYLINLALLWLRDDAHHSVRSV